MQSGGVSFAKLVHDMCLSLEADYCLDDKLDEHVSVGGSTDWITCEIKGRCTSL